MAKADAKRRRNTADTAFRRAWKLLGRLERRLERARTEAAKRTRQQASASGDAVARRAAQLSAAHAEVAEIETLLTELSELIVANARAQAGQVVKDVAHEAAGAVRAAASQPAPRSPKPATRDRATGRATEPASDTTTAAARVVRTRAPKPASPVGPAARRSRAAPAVQASLPTDPTTDA